MFLGMGTLACPFLWLIAAGSFTAHQAAIDVCAATNSFLAGRSEPWIADAFACVTVDASVEAIVIEQTLQTNMVLAGTLLLCACG